MRSAESKHLVVVCLVAAGAALFLTACPRQPEDYIVSEEEEKPYEPEALSSDFRITLQSSGFMDVLSDGSSPEVAPPEAAAQEEEAAASAMEAVAADEGEGEGEMMEEEDEERARRGTVLLEYLVEYFGKGPAPEGIDVEIVQKDPGGQEKGRYDLWVVTDGLTTGTQQVDVGEIEVADYEEGDAFTIEYQGYVPPEKPGEYREFSEAAPGD